MPKFIILLLFFILPPLSLFCKDESALQTVKNIYLLLQNYDEKSPDAKNQRTKIDQYWMLKEISLDAIKDQWQTMSKKEQEKYLKLMRELLLKTIYEDTGKKLKKGISSIYKQQTLNATRAVVKTNLTLKSNNLVVANDFGMNKENGLWKIRDVYIDGANLAQDYRSQYNQIASKYGISGTPNSLLERIESSLKKEDDWYKFTQDESSKKGTDSKETSTPSKKEKKPRPTLIG